MCVGREHFNLCGNCGCPEIVHEQPGIVRELMYKDFGWKKPARGKCTSQIPVPLSEEFVARLKQAKETGEKITVTTPCECPGFKQFSMNMCGGFGASR